MRGARNNMDECGSGFAARCPGLRPNPPGIRLAQWSRLSERHDEVLRVKESRLNGSMHYCSRLQ